MIRNNQIFGSFECISNQNFKYRFFNHISIPVFISYSNLLYPEPTGKMENAFHPFQSDSFLIFFHFFPRQTTY